MSESVKILRVFFGDGASRSRLWPRLGDQLKEGGREGCEKHLRAKVSSFILHVSGLHPLILSTFTPTWGCRCIPLLNVIHHKVAYLLVAFLDSTRILWRELSPLQCQC